jgi:hypothetical protein
MSPVCQPQAVLLQLVQCDVAGVGWQQHGSMTATAAASLLSAACMHRPDLHAAVRMPTYAHSNAV